MVRLKAVGREADRRLGKVLSQKDMVCRCDGPMAPSSHYFLLQDCKQRLKLCSASGDPDL